MDLRWADVFARGGGEVASANVVVSAGGFEPPAARARAPYRAPGEVTFVKWRLVSGWSAAFILLLEFGFFAVLLAPSDGGPHTFANLANVSLILKYSSIFGIGAIGAAMIIGAGGIDLAPGAVIAL